MDWKIFELKNGISVVYKTIEESYSVSMGTFVKAGVRYEMPQYSGISHFVEHLLFKGTTTRNARELKEAIEGKGGSFNAFTAEEITCYHIKILKQHLKTGIEILTDMLVNPLFDPKDIEKERNVILEEINMYLDIPARHVYELLDSVMFENHPLGTSGLGTPETLQNINRNELFDYTDNFHKGKNIVASFAGKFDEDELLKIVESYLGNIPEGKSSSFKPFKNFNSTNKYNIKTKDTEQCHFCIGFYAYPREDERKFPLAVANTILGGNMSSRLFNEVRENRGLVYDIRSLTKSFYDTGAAIISAGLRPENLTACLKVIKDQLHLIMDVKVSQEELERAKEFLVSQFLMGLEDSMEYMLWIGEQKATRNKMMSVKEVEEKIRCVTVEDVQQVCKEIFSKNLFFAMIGPENKEEEVSKILEE
ncbi:MAG: insulinase family protein [Candidatus Omnitrophica bacterium]|nr:insulinase family protein [Candidatus Omnitrophota bacterium]MCM8816950.1 insulinase family protein [Candidatus Omnitrophota bacterium]